MSSGANRVSYLKCRGAGSPTVVLISGKGNGAADWSEVLDPADPEHDADYDAVAWGKGDLHKSELAVFPMAKPGHRRQSCARRDMSAIGTKRTFSRSCREVWFRPKSGQA